MLCRGFALQSVAMSEGGVPNRKRIDEILDAVGGAARRAERDDLADRVAAASSRLDTTAATTLVAGEFKQGKSTLVNALLNAEICPTDDDLSTATPTVIGHAADAGARIVCDAEGGSDDEVTYAVAVEQAGAYVTAGRLADDDRTIRRVEIGLPRRLLEGGLRLVDTPGVGGLESAHGQATLGALSMADVLVFVSDVSQEFTASELAFLRVAAERCPNLLVVMPKIDFYPQWRDIVDRNRHHLDGLGIAAPIFPVSSILRTRAIRSDDRGLNEESGFADLVTHLRDEVIADASGASVRSAMADVDAVATQLLRAQTAERDILRDPSRRDELVAAASAAKDEADRMRSASSRWSTTLTDGIGDLTSDVDHDLRARTKALFAELEAVIDGTDPATAADELFPMVEQRLMAEVTANHHMIAERSTALAADVIRLFDEDLPTDQVASVTAPAEAMAEAGGLQVDIASGPSNRSSLMTGLRGGYGGVLMFGMLGSVVGFAALGPVSIGAGIVMGRKAAREDRNRQLTQRRQQAKLGIRKFIDDVVFRVSKHNRDALKTIQRELRDTNLARANELSRTATDALKAAQSALTTDERETSARLERLDKSIDQLQRITVASRQVVS